MIQVFDRRGSINYDSSIKKSDQWEEEHEEDVISDAPWGDHV